MNALHNTSSSGGSSVPYRTSAINASGHSGGGSSYLYNRWATSNNNTTLLNSTSSSGNHAGGGGASGGGDGGGGSSGLYSNRRRSPTPTRVYGNNSHSSSALEGGHRYSDPQHNWRHTSTASRSSVGRRGVTIASHDPNVYTGGSNSNNNNNNTAWRSGDDTAGQPARWSTTYVSRADKPLRHHEQKNVGLVSSQPRSGGGGGVHWVRHPSEDDEDDDYSEGDSSWTSNSTGDSDSDASSSSSSTAATLPGGNNNSKKKNRRAQRPPASGSDSSDRGTVASMETMSIDLDAEPVVPTALLQHAQQLPFVWNRHASHLVVLLLLQQRGIYLPRYRELIDYHMAELFLHYVDICREGSYFVYYAPDKWPKERFVRIRLLPLDRLATNSEPVPQLVLTMHQSGVHIEEAIPLSTLVGATASPRSPCFRPFLESPNTIIACREGRGHRARLPVDGCFTLWFYDQQSHVARSVDLLTCDPKVFDIWTKAMMGLVSVNSSSVVQTSLTKQGQSVRLRELALAAQKQCEADAAAKQARDKKKGKPSADAAAAGKDHQAPSSSSSVKMSDGKKE